MINNQQMQILMSRLLLTGTLLALILVTAGGSWYLCLHGGAPLKSELLNDQQSINLLHTLFDLKTTTPLGLVELGLYLLIATQVIRLFLLLWFYIENRDIWFSLFTAFIVCLISYSLFFLR